MAKTTVDRPANLGAAALDAFNARQRAIESRHGARGAIFVSEASGEKVYTCHCGASITQDDQLAWGHA
jgi:hypothetical protein